MRALQEDKLGVQTYSLRRQPQDKLSRLFIVSLYQNREKTLFLAAKNIFVPGLSTNHHDQANGRGDRVVTLVTSYTRYSQIPFPIIVAIDNDSYKGFFLLIACYNSSQSVLRRQNRQRFFLLTRTSLLLCLMTLTSKTLLGTAGKKISMAVIRIFQQCGSNNFHILISS